MIKKFVRLIACFCAALLLLGCGALPFGACPPSAAPSASETPQAALTPTPQPHADVSFSDMEYERPDFERMRAQMDDLLQGFESGLGAPQLIDMYAALQRDYARADSMMALSYLLYAFDVTEPYYKNEYAYLQAELTALDLDMTDVSIALFDASEEFKLLAEDAFGSGTHFG